MVPLLTVMSSAAKSEVVSLTVKAKAIVASLVVLPSVTPLVVLVIAIVGGVESLLASLNCEEKIPLP